MSKNRKWKLWRLFMSGALVSMMFVVACGAATEVEQQPAQQPAAPAASQQQAAPAQPAAPSAPSQPAAQQQQAGSGAAPGGSSSAPEPAAQQTTQQAMPTPTSVAQAALAPVSESAMGPREAPSFALILAAPQGLLRRTGFTGELSESTTKTPWSTPTFGALAAAPPSGTGFRPTIL